MNKSILLIVMVWFFMFVSMPGSLQALQDYSENFSYEAVLGHNLGLEGLLSWSLDRYVNEQYFLTGYTSWAAVGDKGGFGIAAFGLGGKFPLSSQLTINVRVMSGVGGGKTIDAGGGFIVIGITALHFSLLPEVLDFQMKYGYLTFPNGSYSNPVFSLGLGYNYKRL